MWRIGRILAVVVVIGVGAAACGGATTEAEPDALALVSQDPLVGIDDGDLVLVELEATWMCEAQRRTSPDASAVDRARERALADAGVPPDAYTAFRLALDERIELREAVLARFLEICSSP